MLAPVHIMLSELHQEDRKAENIFNLSTSLKAQLLEDGKVDVGTFGKADVWTLEEVISNNFDEHINKCLAAITQKNSSFERLKAIQNLDRYLDSIIEDFCNEHAEAAQHSNNKNLIEA